jgi:PTS system glucose-specific IIA component
MEEKVMFKLFKTKEFEIVSPVDGEVVELEQVPDQTFAQKLVGDGAAVIPSSDVFKAPISGDLRMVFRTNHAYIIEAENGIQVMVHIGIDTVHLNGEGFERLAQEGTKVKAGTPIIKVDLNVIKEHQINLVTPVVICERPNVDQIQAVTAPNVKGGRDTIIVCTMN